MLHVLNSDCSEIKNKQILIYCIILFKCQIKNISLKCYKNTNKRANLIIYISQITGKFDDHNNNNACK